MDMNPDRPAYPPEPRTDKPVGDRLTLITILLLIIAIVAVWSWAIYAFD